MTFCGSSKGCNEPSHFLAHHLASLSVGFVLCLPAMKTTIAALLAIVMLAVGGCIGFYFGLGHTKRPASTIAATTVPTASAAASGIGKFLIVSGEYIYAVGEKGTPQRGVFRINTETGESELFREFVDDKGALKLFWDHIE
jgi:hypothetical protein